MKQPRYPVYIISKGRADSMLTSRSLAKMGLNHTIAIEPQDLKDYENALDNFNIREFVTLEVLPFSNHGDGPGRARNWCWDHSIVMGAKRHWVLDDNIVDFYRFHKGLRVRVASPAIFRASEDFVDRFTNVPVSGFQYRFFIAPGGKYPAYVKNTRIYSTLLIENTCPYRWRGRYNEDTDLCLQILKDYDRNLCTIQFNAFLQGKSATQTVSGGNTEEFYNNNDIADAKQLEDLMPAEQKTSWKKEGESGINWEGAAAKSQMLKNMHPEEAGDVHPNGGLYPRPLVDVTWKYQRWHHYVDYTTFKDKKLELRDDFVMPKGVDNYGMRFNSNYSYDGTVV